ncbi:hypothetical protein OIU80_01460 [Flavobacterium sp. LS1R47]|uniref:Lipoprotein n=1 Tax=Flavobacterium frigoritolerans TaxID=2987686 RepID=A0A9X2ZGZ4_9FLAO|nr:hypothetical protein [Flavobacterium frigoritolerans]MCV9930939.1 hypothetical protein [Flavobacterium frigoritolerans]
MKHRTITIRIISLSFIIISYLFSSCKTTIFQTPNKTSDLVTSNTWFVAGPTKENQETINSIREKKDLIRVTAKDSPLGEIELNVMITPSETNDGKPTNLPSNSNFVSITYKSSQAIKLQAREGNNSGTGCVHGGTHAMVDLPASPNTFATIKIPWSDFKLKDKSLNIHNLCKFNFVNYNPISGAILEIKSVQIQNLKP